MVATTREKTPNTNFYRTARATNQVDDLTRRFGMRALSGIHYLAGGMKAAITSRGRVAQLWLPNGHIVAAGKQETIVRATQLAQHGLAVLIRGIDRQGESNGLWEWRFYDRTGKFFAVWEGNRKCSFSLLTDYEANCICRLKRNGQGGHDVADVWRATPVQSPVSRSSNHG